MFKLYLLLSLIVVAVTSGQVQQLNSTNDNLDFYINQNRAIYAQNIRNYDKQLEILKQNYTSSLATINIRLNMLTNSLLQTDKDLNSLEILSDKSHNCVNKYRSSIPTIAATKVAINKCWSNAYNKLDYLLAAPLETRNSLENYYSNNFERSIENCEQQTGIYYNNCVTNVVSNTNTYTNNNQRTFALQMNTAQLRATTNINEAMECSYSTQNKTISLTTEANTLINICLKGQDDCKQCNNSCSYTYYIPSSEVDYNSLIMHNPFYKRYEITSCLMIKIY